MNGKSFIIIGFLLLSTEVYAQPVRIHNGAVTGEEYLRLEDRARQSYVMGLIDGIFLAPLLGGSEQRSSKLGTCVEGSGVGMTGVQLDAILSKYLKDNPGRWHESAHTSMYSALLAVCPGLKG
jgi:Ssp1 endopeptidase immunity protein Rap1a